MCRLLHELFSRKCALHVEKACSGGGNHGKCAPPAFFPDEKSEPLDFHKKGCYNSIKITHPKGDLCHDRY